MTTDFVPLTDDQIKQLIKHFADEVYDLSDPALEIGTGSEWADNQRLAYAAMVELKRRRAVPAPVQCGNCGKNTPDRRPAYVGNVTAEYVCGECVRGNDD